MEEIGLGGCALYTPTSFVHVLALTRHPLSLEGPSPPNLDATLLDVRPSLEPLPVQVADEERRPDPSQILVDRRLGGPDCREYHRREKLRLRMAPKVSYTDKLAKYSSRSIDPAVGHETEVRRVARKWHN